MVKLALAVLVGVAIAGGVPTAFVSSAFAEDPDVHHHDKDAKPGAHGAAHGVKPGGLGGGGAGIAAGIFGAAIGATVVDAITHASAPDPGPAPAPAAGCHFENQPLFDASGQQVASHRVRVCN